MTDFPALPDCLNRKLNGVKTNPASYNVNSRFRSSSKRTRAVKIPDGAVKVYFRDPWRGFASGWNTVAVVKETTKAVHIRRLTERRGTKLSRKLWTSLKKASI